MLQHTHAGCMVSKCCIPPTSSRLGQIQSFSPPCRRYPVALMTASVAQLMWGGFKFPWLGLWNSRGVVLPDDVAPADAWAYYYQHQDPMDLLLVAAYTKHKVAADIVPQDLYGLQLRCSAGDAGQLGLGELFDQWRSWLRCTGPHELLPVFLEPRHFPRAPRGRPWGAWGREGARAHRALCGWLECQECRDPTRRVCWACCVGMCSDCFTWREPCSTCGGRKKMFAAG